MKTKFLLALLPAACLLWPGTPIRAQLSPGAGGTKSAETAQPQAQSIPCVKEGPAATGRIFGAVKDQTGAFVPGVKIEARHLASGAKRSLTTNSQGRFAFEGLPVGRYSITAIATAFQVAIVHDISVAACGETTVNIVLKIAPERTVIEVKPPEEGEFAATAHEVEESDRARSRSAAELLSATPGVSLRENGEFASIPLIHGLGDERAKVLVDGMTVSSSCPNHMNPPLSYISSAQAAKMTVMAGITPASMGGDSIGGTISIESRQPVFAGSGEKLREENTSSGFFRGNGHGYGGSFSEWVGGRNLAIGYDGSWATNDDYTDGSGHQITSTYAQSTDHAVTLAARGAGNLVILDASLHHTPYEGFPNAQMDLVRNYAESLNLHYHRNLGQAALDARVYWQGAWHGMNIGRDKSTFPMPMWMPMQTHGRDLGYSVQLEIPLADRHTLKAGNELHRFVLDDRWPAVPGAAPMMGPDTFVSINDGRRIQLGTFAEVASKWTPKWTTLLGLRNDTVWTNAGPVQGYSAMMYGMDATAFNALDHAKTDVHLDATAVARYEPNAHAGFEFGYSRKTRSPNLYERYAWSTNWMASGMIGWFGDGNYYVGNVALKPETANTASATARWHDRARKEWGVEITPYLTGIQDYIDVDQLATATYGMSTFAQLRFANHNARIYGADLTASGTLWDSIRLGLGKIGGVAGWLHGTRLDTSTGLYQMMPLNARLNFDEELKGLTAGIGLQAVDRKSNVDPNRFEQTTPGYALFSAHSAYKRRHLEASVAGNNLFNKCYELPMGGVNFDDYMASGWMSQIKPLTGRGRSFYGGLTARF